MRTACFIFICLYSIVHPTHAQTFYKDTLCFDENRFTLNYSSIQTLQEVKSRSNAYAFDKIEVISHPKMSEHANYEMRLAMHRITMVSNYLQVCGLDSNIIDGVYSEKAVSNVDTTACPMHNTITVVQEVYLMNRVLPSEYASRPE